MKNKSFFYPKQDYSKEGQRKKNKVLLNYIERKFISIEKEENQSSVNYSGFYLKQDYSQEGQRKKRKYFEEQLERRILKKRSNYD